MKNLILLFAFAMTAGFVSAQEVAAKKTCSKAEKAACAKKCTAAEKKACGLKNAAGTASLTDVTTESEASASNVLSASAAADILAESDESISRKECPMSGNITYFKKSQCAKSGKVSMNEVKYCSDSKAFVNASPSEVMSDQEAKVIKTADTVDGKVQSTKSTKKACCKGKKKCSSKKAGA